MGEVYILEVDDNYYGDTFYLTINKAEYEADKLAIKLNKSVAVVTYNGSSTAYHVTPEEAITEGM